MIQTASLILSTSFSTCVNPSCTTFSPSLEPTTVISKSNLKALRIFECNTQGNQRHITILNAQSIQKWAAHPLLLPVRCAVPLSSTGFAPTAGMVPSLLDGPIWIKQIFAEWRESTLAFISGVFISLYCISNLILVVFAALPSSVSLMSYEATTSSQLPIDLFVRHVFWFAVVRKVSTQESICSGSIKEMTILFLVSVSPPTSTSSPRSPLHQYRQKLQHSAQTITNKLSNAVRKLNAQEQTRNVVIKVLFPKDVWQVSTVQHALQSTSKSINWINWIIIKPTVEAALTPPSTKSCPMCGTEDYNGSCDGCGWGDLFPKT